MALKLELELKNSGVVSEYLKLSNLHVNGNQAQVSFLVYKDEAARTAGKDPIDEVTVVLEGAEKDALIQACYIALKDTAILSGAVVIN